MRRIEIAPYDPAWRELFEIERQLISEALGAIALDVHHIGSTSVPGLAAKPIIDIILEVSSLEDLDQRESALASLGYESKGEYGIERRRFFPKGGGERTHHIHAFKAGDPHVVRHLAFRDYLRAHPAISREYEALKTRVAASCNNDIDTYCDGKDSFIKDHERLALAWLSENEQADAAKP